MKTTSRTRSDAARIGGLARVNPANPDIRERRKLDAVALRLEGNSYRKIASKLRISSALSHELCREAFAEEQGDGQERAARIRAEQLAMLESVQCRLLQTISRGDGRGEKRGGKDGRSTDIELVVKVSSALVKLWDRQAKLLGLDAEPGHGNKASGGDGMTIMEFIQAGEPSSSTAVDDARLARNSPAADR